MTTTTTTDNNIPCGFIYNPETGESSREIDDIQIIVKPYYSDYDGGQTLYEFRVISTETGSLAFDPVGGYGEAQQAANAAFEILDRIAWHRGEPPYNPLAEVPSEKLRAIADNLRELTETGETNRLIEDIERELAKRPAN